MKYLNLLFVFIFFVGCAKTKEEKAIKKVDDNITIRLEGKVFPIEDRQVLSMGNGYVKLYIKNGDVVKKGDLLYELDDKLIQMKIKKLNQEIKDLYAKKHRLEAESKNDEALNLSAIELKKVAYLSSQSAVSEFEANSYKKAYISNLNRAKNDEKAVKARIEEIKLSIKDKKYQLELEKYALKHLKGYAPTSGFITNINVNENQKISQNQVICRILNIDRVIVRAGLASGLLPFVHKNQKVKIDFVTTPPYSVKSVITKVNPIIDKDFDLMTVDINIKNHNYILQNGVRALVTIDLPKKAQQKAKEIFYIRHNLMDVRSDI